MVRRPERNFYEQLKRNVPKLGMPTHLVRIENVAAVGTPDVNYCIRGIEGWAELKAWERIRLSGRFTVPKLRPEQAVWLANRSRAGGRAYLLCKINRGVALLDGRFVPALYDKALHLDWVDAPEVASYWDYKQIDWSALVSALTVPPLEDRDVLRRLGLFRPRYPEAVVEDL